MSAIVIVYWNRSRNLVLLITVLVGLHLFVGVWFQTVLCFIDSSCCMLRSSGAALQWMVSMRYWNGMISSFHSSNNLCPSTFCCNIIMFSYIMPLKFLITKYWWIYSLIVCSVVLVVYIPSLSRISLVDKLKPDSDISFVYCYLSNILKYNIGFVWLVLNKLLSRINMFTIYIINISVINQ